MTLSSLLTSLDKDKNLVNLILADLENYCKRLKAAIDKSPELLKLESSKLCAVNSSQSHQIEIITRLNLLKEFAACSEFEISKA